MSLAKRLEEPVREDWATESQADAVLDRRAELWNGREPDGQMLLAFSPLLKEPTSDK